MSSGVSGPNSSLLVASIVLLPDSVFNSGVIVLKQLKSVTGMICVIISSKYYTVVWCLHELLLASRQKMSLAPGSFAGLDQSKKKQTKETLFFLGECTSFLFFFIDHRL